MDAAEKAALVASTKKLRKDTRSLLDLVEAIEVEAPPVVPPPPPVQPTGPGITRYQDLPSPHGLLHATGVISFPPGVTNLGPGFEFPPNYPVYGDLAMDATGLVGSGMDATVLQVPPNTMSPETAAKYVADQSTSMQGGTNRLWLLRVDSGDVTDLAIHATPQSAQEKFNGLQMYESTGRKVARVRFKGFVGDSGANPGETFPNGFYKTVNGLIDQCEIDGYGFGAEATVRKTATGIGLDFCHGNIVRDTRIFGVQYFPIATYQCTGILRYERLDLRGNTRGLNFEMNHGATVEIVDCDFRGSSTTGWHVRVDSSQTPSCVVNVRDPKFDPIDGKFIFRNNPSYNYPGGDKAGAQNRSDLHLFIGGVERPDLVGFVNN